MQYSPFVISSPAFVFPMYPKSSTSGDCLNGVLSVQWKSVDIYLMFSLSSSSCLWYSLTPCVVADGAIVHVTPAFLSSCTELFILRCSAIWLSLFCSTLILLAASVSPCYKCWLIKISCHVLRALVAVLRNCLYWRRAALYCKVLVWILSCSGVPGMLQRRCSRMMVLIFILCSFCFLKISLQKLLISRYNESVGE